MVRYLFIMATLERQGGRVRGATAGVQEKEGKKLAGFGEKYWKQQQQQQKKKEWSQLHSYGNMALATYCQCQLAQLEHK